MVNQYGSEEMEPVLLERTHLQPNFRRGEVTTRSQKRLAPHLTPAKNTHTQFQTLRPHL
jgi:hypothetical protein